MAETELDGDHRVGLSRRLSSSRRRWCSAPARRRPAAVRPAHRRDDHPGVRLRLLQRRHAGAAAAAVGVRRCGRRAGAPDHHARRDRVQLGHGTAGAEPARRRPRPADGSWLQAARAVLVNPIIMAHRARHSVQPERPRACRRWSSRPCRSSAGAAAPSALFALGASLSLRRIAGSLGPAGTDGRLQAVPASRCSPGSLSPGCSSSTRCGATPA